MLINPYIYGGGLPQVPASPVLEATFKNVVLFVDGQGASGSTTITDRSLHQLLPTAADATISYDTSQTRYGTASLYSSAGHGLAYQTLNDHQALLLGAQDWTVELSIRADSLAQNLTLFSLAQAEAAGRYVWFVKTDGSVVMDRYAAPNSPVFGAAGTIAAGVWYDIAVVRQGGNVSMYKNGVLLATVTGDNNLAYAGQVMGNNTGGMVLGGGPAYHIANVRVTRGLARSISPMSKPFDYGYDPTSLSLPFESAPGFYANSSVVDDTGIHSQGTVPGNATVSTDPTYAYWGRSGAFFNNAGLSLNSVNTEQFDGMDWTISGAFFLTAAPSSASGGIMGLLSTFLNNAGWRLFVDSNRQLNFQTQLTDNTLWSTTGVRALQTNRWHFFAVSRKGQLVSVFANGVPVGVGLLPAATTRFKDATSTVVNVGMEQGATWYLTGYMDAVRIKVGSGDYAVTWPANPTASYPLDRTGDRYLDDVALLMPGDTLLDVSMRPKAIANTGVVTSSAVQQFGKNTLYFAAGAYLSLAAGTELALGAADFAIEFDYYSLNDTFASNTLMASRAAATDAGFQLDVTATGLLFTPVSGGTALSIPVASGKLCHVAIQRRNGVFMAFVDAALVGWLNVAAQNITYSGTLTIGKSPTTAAIFKGYLGNLRITINRARVFPAQVASVPTQPQARTYARLDAYDRSVASATLSNFNLGFVGMGAVRATVGLSTGKWYWEVASSGSRYPIVGVGTTDATVEGTGVYPGADSNGWSYFGLSAMKITGGVQTAYGSAWNNPAHVIGVYLDCDAGTLGFTKNGVDMGIAFTGLQGKTLYPMVGGDTGSASSQATLNFGQSAFANPVPAGYNKGAYVAVVEDVATYAPADDTEYHANLKVPGDATAFQKSVVWDQGRYAFRQTDTMASGVSYTAKVVKSGNTSLYVPNTGTLVTWPNDSAFNLNIARWTLRCWAYELPGSLGSLLCRRASTSSGAGWVWTTYGFRAKVAGTWADPAVAGARPAANTWNHYEMVKDGSTLYLFVNGVLQAARGDATSMDDLALAVVLGCADDVGENRFLGYINDLEFIPGVALHNSSFVPPTQAFGTDAAADPYWASTVLLLHANGPNASTTLVDTARPNRSFGVGGNAQLSTARPKFGNAAMQFDGSGDYWTVATDPDFDFVGGDFTIEGFFQTDTLSGLHAICGTANGSAQNNNFGWMMLQNDASVQLSCFGGGNTLFASASHGGVQLGVTHHFAVQRKGDTLQMWLDGNAGAMANMAAGFVLNSPLNASFWIGQMTSTVVYPWAGMIDELRITKGVARYAPSTNFAPPTSPYPSDGALDPYYSSVKLLVHAEGVNGSKTIIDSSPVVGRTLATQGAASISTAQAKYGSGSLVVGGGTTGNNVVSDTSDDFALATAPFTVEAYVYVTGYTANGGRIMSAASGAAGFNSTNGIHWLMQILANGALNFQVYDGNTGALSLTGPVQPLNTWVHVAATYDGGVLRWYYGGVLVGKLLTGGLVRPSMVPTLVIGGINGEAANSSFPFNGYIDEIRITKGVCRYGVDAQNFVPPAQPYGNNVAADPYFANVQLLLHGEGPNGATTGVVDSSSRNFAVTATVQSQFSTAIVKFGTSSLLLPGGTASTFDIPDDPAWAFGLNDFTLETFGYFTSAGGSTYRQILGQRTGAATGWTWAFSGGNIYLWVDAKLYGSCPLPTGYLDSWHHYALQRKDGINYFYCDGVVLGSAVGPASMPDYAAVLQIGGPTTGGQAGNMLSGYVDELRITTKVARYPVQGFVPPVRAAAALPAPAAYSAPLKYWLDASDAATITQANGTITGWTEKVAGLVFAQPTAGLQPVLNNALMALPCVDFGMGLHSWLTNATGMKLRRIATVFIVGYWNNRNSQYSSINLQANSNSNAQQGGTGLPSFTIYTAGNGGAGIEWCPDGINNVYDSSYPIPKGSSFIIEVSSESIPSQIQLVTNGVSKSVPAGTKLPETSTVKVIGNTDDLYLSNGAFGEIRIYDGYLTPQERAKIRTELAIKWKLGA